LLADPPPFMHAESRTIMTFMLTVCCFADFFLH